MNVDYLHDVTDDYFMELADERKKDNVKMAKILLALAEGGHDKKVNFMVLNLGTLMQIIAISLELKQNEIEEFLKLEKHKTRSRKMENILKELNERINLRYGFAEETNIVPYLYTYKGQGYVFIDKTLFLSLLEDMAIDMDSLANV